MENQQINVAKPSKKIEQELSHLSGGIDYVLRSHFADRRLRKLLLPPNKDKNGQVQKNVVFWLPAWQSVIAGLVAYVLAQNILSSMRFIPFVDLLSWGPCLAAGWFVETRLLPKLFFSGFRFRLMRMVQRFDNQEFPDQYVVAPIKGSVTGFGFEYWKPARGVDRGHLLVSISKRSDDVGVALIHLRTEGELAVSSWLRDLYIDNVLQPLPADVKTLALEFDAACDKYVQLAPKSENSRALRAQKDEPIQRSLEEVWSEVAIPSDVKNRLISLASHFAEESAAASRGLLLYGPPGTGKTLIAKSLAESMGCSFFPLSLPDIKGSHIGESGERVKALWKNALAQPRSVLFVDECEGVFCRRGTTNTDSFSEEIVQSFLAEWDGFSKQTKVWVVGATNRRDLIDPAILSRFGEEVEIGLPSEQQRLDILAKELAKKGYKTDIPNQAAELTQGLSGRDLEVLASRLAREQSKIALSNDVLSRYAQAFRKQGSIQTDSTAVWDKLILPERVLKELKTTATLLQQAEAAIKRGLNVPRGLLLYGPPGTGKTQIARTLANESGLKFISASTAEIKAGFIGQSGQKVREIFERARESAPCLLFLDEIDIVVPARGGSGDSDQFTQEIVGQLLQEMDGVKAETQSVFVLAATNRIDQIDSAVISRFAKKIEIPVPDSEARQKLLTVLLGSKPIAFDLNQIAGHLAEHGEGMSGRDIRNWIDQAEHNAVGRAIEAGDLENASIILDDFPSLQTA